MSQQELEDEEMETFRMSFNHFDKDRNGKVTEKEIGDLLRTMGKNPTDAEIKQMIQTIDLDKNGTLSFEEFVKYAKSSACYQTKEQQEREMREAFQLMDKNKNGYISEKELRKVMKNCGERLTDDEVADMMKIADINGDGKIDYNEFVKNMVP